MDDTGFLSAQKTNQSISTKGITRYNVVITIPFDEK